MPLRPNARDVIQLSLCHKIHRHNVIQYTIRHRIDITSCNAKYIILETLGNTRHKSTVCHAIDVIVANTKYLLC